MSRGTAREKMWLWPLSILRGLKTGGEGVEMGRDDSDYA